MKFNLIAKIEIEVDGELYRERAIEICQKTLRVQGVFSEDYNGTYDWAILVNSVEINEDKEV
jgi:hypothetical protein